MRVVDRVHATPRTSRADAASADGTGLAELAQAVLSPSPMVARQSDVDLCELRPSRRYLRRCHDQQDSGGTGRAGDLDRPARLQLMLWMVRTHGMLPMGRALPTRIGASEPR